MLSHTYGYTLLQLCIGHSLTGDDIMRVGDVELILWELILWHQIDIIDFLQFHNITVVLLQT